MANENETVEQVCEKMDNESGEYHIDDYGLSSYDIGLYKDRILAAHKREIDELKKQVSIAKDAFFKIAQRKHSREVHDIVCEAEFMMNHPECRNEVANG